MKNMTLKEAKTILVSTETACFWENNGENVAKEKLGEAIHTVLDELERLEEENAKLKEAFTKM